MSLFDDVKSALVFDSPVAAALQYFTVAEKAVRCLFTPEDNEVETYGESLAFAFIVKDVAKMIAKKSRGSVVDLSGLVPDVVEYLERVALLREEG